MPEDVKPYADEELQTCAASLHEHLEGGWCKSAEHRDAFGDSARLLLVIQEDRRKLAIAEEALRKISKYMQSYDGGDCAAQEADTIASQALLELTTANTDA